MNKKEIMEIKKRLKKEGCTFTRMCGCYVDGEHNRITRLGKTFLNLDEEEFFKYLELAKKVFPAHLVIIFLSWNFLFLKKSRRQTTIFTWTTRK